MSGVWKDGIHEDKVVAAALSNYFPYVDVVWPFFIFLLGYSSLIAFFSVGRKAALFLSPKYGAHIYFIYAICAFLLFSCAAEHYSLMIMSISGMLLLAINLFGIFRLRNNIRFSATIDE